MEKIKLFVKNNIVMCIALVIAIGTSFIVPPDAQYLEYFDFKTLICLFTTLTVVCAFKNIDFFYCYCTCCLVF